MIFTDKQRNTICLLIGILLLAMAFSRAGWFWILGWPGAWLYNLFIFTGWLLVGCFSARLVGLRGTTGIIVLVIAEAAFFAGQQWVVVNQPQNLPKIIFHFVRSLYYGQNTYLQYDESLSRYDSQLGYLYKPGVESSYEKWEFGPDIYKTNSLGVRDDEASARNPSIIAIGDSYTTGWGVGQKETFASRLEQLGLVKVLNAGVSSYGTVREGLLLGRLPMDSCKLVVLQYCHNDFQENKEWADKLLRGEKFRPTLDATSFGRMQVQNDANKIYVPFKWTFEFGQKALKFLVLPSERRDVFAWGRALEPEATVHYFFQTIRLIRKVYQGNILVVSTSGDNKADVDFIAMARKYASTRSVPGIYFLDTASILTPEDNYLIDGHYTATGHLKIARQLYSFIRKKRLLDQPAEDPSH